MGGVCGWGLGWGEGGNGWGVWWDGRSGNPSPETDGSFHKSSANDWGHKSVGPTDNSAPGRMREREKERMEKKNKE